MNGAKFRQKRFFVLLSLEVSSMRMNHVAHCLLSFPDEELLVGNFIGDYVKGSTWKRYPEAIQKGILLHRFIDAFSDAHPALRRSARRLRPLAGRFAAPIVDILYDHLLCRLWEQAVGELPFEHFAAWVYDALDEAQCWMPEALQRRWPDMMAGRFLHLYRSAEGLSWTLERFSHRLPGASNWQEWMLLFSMHTADFTADFSAFYPELNGEVTLWRRRHGLGEKE